MKFTISYGRKVRVEAYETMELTLHAEFDDSVCSWSSALDVVKAWVDENVEKHADELLQQSLKELPR